MIRITMQNGKTIDLELDHSAAPITCENFEKLVKQGFYNGLTFHRVISGFMIQGGDPQGTGMGGPGWHIKGEFLQNALPTHQAHPRRHQHGPLDGPTRPAASSSSCIRMPRIWTAATPPSAMS